MDAKNTEQFCNIFAKFKGWDLFFLLICTKAPQPEVCFFSASSLKLVHIFAYATASVYNATMNIGKICWTTIFA